MDKSSRSDPGPSPSRHAPYSALGTQVCIGQNHYSPWLINSEIENWKPIQPKMPSFSGPSYGATFGWSGMVPNWTVCKGRRISKSCLWKGKSNQDTGRGGRVSGRKIRKVVPHSAQVIPLFVASHQKQYWTKENKWQFFSRCDNFRNGWIYCSWSGRLWKFEAISSFGLQAIAIFKKIAFCKRQVRCNIRQKFLLMTIYGRRKFSFAILK